MTPLSQGKDVGSWFSLSKPLSLRGWFPRVAKQDWVTKGGRWAKQEPEQKPKQIRCKERQKRIWGKVQGIPYQITIKTDNSGKYFKRRGESRSPMSDRRRHQGDREEPEPNKCLGVFGLSLYTTERELEKEFGRFGALEKTQVVLDGHSGRSRGFAFVYFENIKSATDAREAMNGLELDGRKIRVDFSITKRPHTPTPGMYMGRPTDARDGFRGDRGRGDGRGRGRGRGGRGDFRGGDFRGGPPRHYDDVRGPPPRHYDDRGPPPRHYDDRYAAPLDRYADRYGPPPPRHYDDRGPPPRHYDDRYGSSSSSRGGSRYYEERSYDRRGGVDRYAGGGAERYYSVGDPYRDDRYSGSSHGTRRPRSPSPFYRDTRYQLYCSPVLLMILSFLGRGGITEAEAGAMRGRQDLHCLQDRLWLQDTERRMHSQEIK